MNLSPILFLAVIFIVLVALIITFVIRIRKLLLYAKRNKREVSKLKLTLLIIGVLLCSLGIYCVSLLVIRLFTPLPTPLPLPLLG